MSVQLPALRLHLRSHPETAAGKNLIQNLIKADKNMSHKNKIIITASFLCLFLVPSVLIFQSSLEDDVFLWDVLAFVRSDARLDALGVEIAGTIYLLGLDGRDEKKT